ncbi:hypothetical protein CYV19_18875 [Natronobacterium gregoryi SP2]|uniref:Uncharacterized protein n=1 Tax=Natronobacterium gregoryi (strain ATCC 43098 / DSM 3393 / CCM 3738 / CIP 104747 / IAM 13177 / JCM 8860 / NBRC 102187 / NCIMB 2189 / SP2) TaxID=797304 RepID=L9XWD4_NATGS|nr:hypothetical protein C490_13401 [Natronobacterium gregoryi SP2]PLK17736.1 hypothetical protein CYV19_18875 [Natronobacterium gregoryi SP2]
MVLFSKNSGRPPPATADSTAPGWRRIGRNRDVGNEISPREARSTGVDKRPRIVAVQNVDPHQRLRSGRDEKRELSYDLSKTAIWLRSTD